jgi:hypothetical protein
MLLELNHDTMEAKDQSIRLISSISHVLDRSGEPEVLDLFWIGGSAGTTYLCILKKSFELKSAKLFNYVIGRVERLSCQMEIYRNNDQVKEFMSTFLDEIVSEMEKCVENQQSSFNPFTSSRFIQLFVKLTKKTLNDPDLLHHHQPTSFSGPDGFLSIISLTIVREAL